MDPGKAKAAEAKATKEGLGSAFKAYTDLKDFVNALTTPRRIVMLVPAGKPVDSALAALGPLLDRGDCVVDGGNEWYENTERRAAQFSALGLHYVGCGVSGGAEGRRHGPSLMAGGPREAFDLLEPTLKKIAAQVDGPCLGYLGAAARGVEIAVFGSNFDKFAERCTRPSIDRHTSRHPERPQIEGRLNLLTQAEPAIMLRWCTTASSTAICS